MIDLKSIQTEIDASYLYKVLSDNEEDPNVANVFRQMSERTRISETASENTFQDIPKIGILPLAPT